MFKNDILQLQYAAANCILNCKTVQYIRKVNFL